MTTIDDADPWTALERAGHVLPASDDVLVAARAAVRRAAATEALRADVARVRRRRRWRIGLVAATVAAALTLGATTVEVGDQRIGVSPAAAAVLERAAKATLAESDPVVRPGQYLRITLVQQTWTDGRRNERWKQRWTRTIWVPYDRDADWTFRERTRTPDAPAAIAAVYRQADGTRRGPSWSNAGSGAGTYLRTYDPDWYATLPRDPDALLGRLRKELGGDGSGLTYNVREIYSEALRSGLAPAAFRARLFEALATVPGVHVQENVRTLDGKIGVGIGYSSRASSWRMVFDKQTGRYIGEWAREGDLGGLTPGEPSFVTSVRTDVVDSAPAPD
ncbi:CU044_5270 family protein [Mumia quercus]|uniref:CU044_5270 family protein n=1 Tax=Mumia quercus TaxID=2976125 RepID=UPI0021D12360|nr:CU044_5270 family protein [Mumia quercus]